MAETRQEELLAGRYRPLRVLGTGGMARVHLAEDERLGRKVAVKQMHAHSADDVAVRFEREAKLGASLNHPNLVSIYDIETEDESVLIVMEFVDGETLHDAIARAPLAPERVAEIVTDIASGLDHAHRQGVVHRDVKPANILIRHDGTAKLADLGIAMAAQSTSITRSGTVLGTAAYMAPEQLDGGVAGPRSDVYALAAVAFEALCGKKARSGDTPLEIANDVVKGPAPDLTRCWSGAPPAAASVLARAMARRPEERQHSAGALAGELAHALRTRHPAPATAVAPSAAAPRRTAVGPRTRNWVPAAVMALMVAAALAIGAAALRGGGDDGSPARDAAQSGASATSSGEDAKGTEKRDSAVASTGSGSNAAADDSTAAPSAGGTSAPADTSEPTTDDPAALNDQGFSLMQAGDYDAAIPLLERAVAAYPEDSQDLTYAYALYNLGRSLRLAGRPDEAVPILERRLRIPDQTDTVQRELDAARAAAG
jgi:eukaryotic-like serine/threonine-protein kinase